MSNDGKKIAFSFSKVKKTPLVNKVILEPKEKIEYVDCFDGSKGKFSFKGQIKNDKEEKIELVIPMPAARTSTDIVKSRIEEKANKNLLSNESIKVEGDKSEDKKETQSQSQNLDHLAAQEILNEIKNGDVDKKSDSKLVIESIDVTQHPSEYDIDYDNIPVTDFGLAMLRGMGWRPDLGIGKEPRLVETVSPKLRPRGLGLGAKPTAKTNDDKESEKSKRHPKPEIKEKSKHTSSDTHKKKSHRH